MGASSVSPGGALLRSSRMFSIPKPLPEPPSSALHVGQFKSNTMTRSYPQHQSITSPLSSREKGDWGFKRSFPLKSTLATSTPLIRVKQVDTIENVTDFSSAADHTLSLEKFQELRVAMTVPRVDKASTARAYHGLKSVFEENSDITDLKHGQGDEHRWRYRGPWLARMTAGNFDEYLTNNVRPRRAEFRAMLKKTLAQNMTTRQNNIAMENGTPPPPKIQARDVTDAQLTDYLRTLRNDRVSLYAIISRFLDLAPLGMPTGFVSALWEKTGSKTKESPYGKTGPPPSHPSAGISYLRTSSFMENHPVYGPQSRREPSLARVVLPRQGPNMAKMGLGGFVADAPTGDNEFNVRYGKSQRAGNKSMLTGITHLDTTTFGGAKAYVEAETANIDPSGKVILRLRETKDEARLVAREGKGHTQIYTEDVSSQEVEEQLESRMDRVADDILEQGSETPQVEEQDVVSSSQAYGLDVSPGNGQQ